MAAAIPETLRSLGFASISGTYAFVGTAIDNNWRMFRLINNTNGDMFFSVDGTNNNYFVPASSFVLYDLATNSAPVTQSDGFVLKIGTRFSVKQSTAATSGSVYIEGIYAKGQ